MSSLKALSFFLIFSLLACSPTDITMNQAKDNSTSKKIDWQGHRGARGLLPENTIPAFLKALEYPVQTLELDVAVSKDQQLIVTHEPWFSHHICSHPDGRPVSETEAQSLRIYDFTYEEIKTFDVGLRGNERFPQQEAMATYKPSFQDMVRAVETYCKKQRRTFPFYNIEIKSGPELYDSLVPQPKDFVRLVLKEITELGVKDRCCIQSFDLEVLRELNRQAPEQRIAFLVENTESFEVNMSKLDFVPPIYSPYFLFVDRALVEAVHAKNMQLIPWTVNEVEQMKTLIDLGVDGIITDYPNKIATVD